MMNQPLPPSDPHNAPPPYPGVPQNAPPAGGPPIQGSPMPIYRPYQPPAPPPPPEKSKIGLILTIVAVVVALLVGGLIWENATSPKLTPPTVMSTTEATPDSPNPTKGDKFSNLKPGDCVADEDELNQMQAKIVPCSTAHKYEVIHLEYISWPNYPDADGAKTRARKICAAAFQKYLGIPNEDSEFDLVSLWPSKNTWAEGDRGVMCAAGKSEPFTGSVKDINR